MVLRRISPNPSLGTGTGSRTEIGEGTGTSEPHQQILRCMLSKYEEEEHGLLKKCFDLEPPLTGGALCVQVCLTVEVHTLISPPSAPQRAMLDCFLEFNLLNQGEEQSSLEIQSFRSDSKKALDFLLSTVTDHSSSSSSSQSHPVITHGTLSPDNILNSFYDHSLCLPSSLSGTLLTTHLESLNYSATSRDHPSREVCLRNLSIAALWMGTHLGVGQRTEKGLKDWLFPPPCECLHLPDPPTCSISLSFTSLTQPPSCSTSSK
jgi:hypothetical protein